MNQKSFDIIKTHIKPDEELIKKTKENAINYPKSESKSQIIKICIAACLVLSIGLSAVLTYGEYFADDPKPTKPIETLNNQENKQLFYSELSSPSQIDKNLINFKSDFQTADIASFNEASLRDNCVSIVEGEIISITPKEYVIVSEYEKFGNNTITEKVHTLIYKLRVTNTRYGNIPGGKTILIEDRAFFIDEFFSLKVGHRYILPLCYDDGEITEPTGNIISGNTKRESPYSTIYPFHPQIEAVEGGYLFTNDWKSLNVSEAQKIVMDIELNERGKYYEDKMLFLSKSAFEKNFKKITDELQ
ncbi:MAG: hypothetical protein IJZ88_01125 [Clostridia bacterium]|nr:hypothetical protein [Clostridia bacterium]